MINSILLMIRQSLTSFALLSSPPLLLGLLDSLLATLLLQLHLLKPQIREVLVFLGGLCLQLPISDMLLVALVVVEVC